MPRLLAWNLPQPPAEEPEAILIRTPNWLGDLMIATAFIRAVMSRFPGVPVDLIVRAGFEQLPLPHRGVIHPYDRRTESAGTYGRRMRGQGHTHVFVLPPSFSSAWMAFRAGIPHRIGHGGEGRRWLLTRVVPLPGRPRWAHLVREHLSLLEPWGLPTPVDPVMRLDINREWIARHFPGELQGSPPYVVLAPGAEYGPAKQWPLVSYRRTAGLLSRTGRRIVVAGLAKDGDAAREILRDVSDGVNLCGRTSLPGLAALLAGAELLISNDSGAMHLAAALGIPQVALFGSTSPAWTAPLNPRATVLYRGVSCSPCFRRTCPYGHTRCLTEIPAEEAVEQAMRLLGPGPARRSAEAIAP